MNIFKKLIIIILVSVVSHVHAQYNTGDAELNKSLLTIDADAKLDFGAFKVRLGGSYNVTEKKLDYLSANVGMSAGDIYMSLEVAKITRKNLDEVINVYSSNKDRGWGVIAKELGIKPGSPEFHALKGNAKNKGNKKSKGKKAKGKKGKR
ncbi:MAG: hypothetical protein OEW67_06000 [Cyclobacteriaceae bacterium]|nr:hypothetical protein [Cyclobacteriaceae bacterium]